MSNNVSVRFPNEETANSFLTLCGDHAEKFKISNGTFDVVFDEMEVPERNRAMVDAIVRLRVAGEDFSNKCNELKAALLKQKTVSFKEFHKTSALMFHSISGGTVSHYFCSNMGSMISISFDPETLDKKVKPFVNAVISANEDWLKDDVDPVISDLFATTLEQLFEVAKVEVL